MIADARCPNALAVNVPTFESKRRSKVQSIHAVARELPVHQILGMHQLHGRVHVHRGAGQVVVAADADDIRILELFVEQRIRIGAVAVVRSPRRVCALRSARDSTGMAARITRVPAVNNVETRQRETRELFMLALHSKCALVSSPDVGGPNLTPQTVAGQATITQSGIAMAQDDPVFPMRTEHDSQTPRSCPVSPGQPGRHGVCRPGGQRPGAQFAACW